MPTAKVNGAEMYYEEAGSGPPVILSPGGLQGMLASYQPVTEKRALYWQPDKVLKELGLRMLARPYTDLAYW